MRGSFPEIGDWLAADLFQRVLQTPAVQGLVQRLEKGSALSLAGVSMAAQPFVAVLLHKLFPRRTMVVVTDGVKAQELFDQDVRTWLGLGEPAAPSPEAVSASRSPALFYPGWEVLPHESKLPHADVISERLQTLSALSARSHDSSSSEPAPIIVTNVMALMQRTFAPGAMEKRTRTLRRGTQIDPLDLVEWLEDQGYEPEAKVTQKGEISLRGGILDVFPLTSPWPVRLEFFGDELNSLRSFNPGTQISREPVDHVVLPPGGELSLIKKELEKAAQPSEGATLLDYLPPQSLLVLCAPDVLAEHASAYEEQVPAGDPFFENWELALDRAAQRRLATVSLLEEREPAFVSPRMDEELSAPPEDPQLTTPPDTALQFPNLDAFRPLGERPAETPVAEAQRREFFDQLHRWLRQGYAVACLLQQRRRAAALPGNLAGIRARRGRERRAPAPAARAPNSPWTSDAPRHLARGFLCEQAKLVVVTDAEIFGRYKVQRPRRLKSPHAQAARSALDIDFTDLEEGDYRRPPAARHRAIHRSAGAARRLGSKTATSPLEGSPGDNEAHAGQECLVIEYAPSDPRSRRRGSMCR